MAIEALVASCVFRVLADKTPLRYKERRMLPKLSPVPTLILLLTILTIFHKNVSAQGPLPIIQVTGKVKVNGGEVQTNTVIFSGVTIQTAVTNSSAVVSLGKLGRLELQENTEIKIDFSDTRMVILLMKPGKIRLTTPPGVGATIRSAEIQAVVDKAEQNEFSLETTCNSVTVNTKSGRVILGVGGSTLVVKRIPAGSTETVDTPKSLTCK